MKNLKFIREKDGVYSTVRIKRGREKEFTIEKDSDGWTVYTKGKNGEWTDLKVFSNISSAKAWLEKNINKINMQPEGKKLLKRLVNSK